MAPKKKIKVVNVKTTAAAVKDSGISVVASVSSQTATLAAADVPIKKETTNTAVTNEIAWSRIPATLPERPTPNLGYACLNVSLRNQKPTFFCNRTCRLATIKEKGLPFVSQLALQNCRDLIKILQWNHEHGVRFFRLSSDFFPWGNVHYRLKELPNYEEIKQVLAVAGNYARATNQRLTAHPCEFVKLAGQTDKLVQSSIDDLELHSEMFDLLGYEPSPYNKCNIHIGGTYNDKEETLRRFAANFRKLSPACQKRVTVENDDRASMYSIRDLLPLHDMIGVPLVFDFHHYKFCTGDQTAEEALKAAVATWPTGVRPVVHWSESQGGKAPHAHSDYIGQEGVMNLYGLDREVDVMIESKAKELSLLLYRDIVANGLSGREPFFLGIDAIEEEARQAEEAKAAGLPFELDPVPSVVLEGTEIIPVNDKRLHGRSQRRNKAAVAKRAKAAAAAAQAEEGSSVVTVSEETETVAVKVDKPKRSRSKKADAAAAIEEASEAAVAAPVQDGDAAANVAKPKAKKPRAPRGKKVAAESNAAAEVAAATAEAAAADVAEPAAGNPKKATHNTKVPAAAEMSAASDQLLAAAKASAKQGSRKTKVGAEMVTEPGVAEVADTAPAAAGKRRRVKR